MDHFTVTNFMFFFLPWMRNRFRKIIYKIYTNLSNVIDKTKGVLGVILRIIFLLPKSFFLEMMVFCLN